MDQIAIFKATLEAALEVEDKETERLADRGQDRMAAEHFHRARGILYAIQLMADPTYLRRQAEILDVLPKAKAARKNIDAEMAMILSIEKDLKRLKA